MNWSTEGKRIILTATAGRTGTGYLCALLQGFEELRCLHEPQPDFTDVMRAAQTEPTIAERFLVESTLPSIRSVAEPTYFETSHLACKGFI